MLELLIVEDFNEIWRIFELKRCNTPVLKNLRRRNDFRSEFSTYLRQCREYARLFYDQSIVLQFEQKYNARVQREVPSIIVASTSESADTIVAHDLLADGGNHITLMTYTEVLNTLYRQLEWTASDSTGRKGIYACLFGIFPVSLQKQVILNFGKSLEKNRCSIGFQGRDITVDIIDSNGQIHSFRSEKPRTIRPDMNHNLELIEIEIGFSSRSSFVSISHNNRLLRLEHSSPIRLNHDALLGGMAMGTNSTGDLPANFSIVEIILYNKILSPVEKISISEHFSQTYKYYLSPMFDILPSRIEFVGKKFMTTAGHPLSTEVSPESEDSTSSTGRRLWAWYQAGNENTDPLLEKPTSKIPE